MTTNRVIYARFFLALLFATALISCAGTPAQSNSIKIKRLVFLNQSTSNLSNVRIFISNTNELASCGYILPKTECSTGFRLREYKGNRFDVSWMDNGQQKSVKNIMVHVPEGMPTDNPVHVVIVFGEQGQFSAFLQPIKQN